MLDVRGLSVAFRTERGRSDAVTDVSLRVHAARTLAVVGESGSGKTVTSLAVMDLLDRRSADVRAARMRLGGEELQDLTAAQRRRRCGNRMAMVFQDPMTALNPYLRVGAQLTEVLQTHRGLAGGAATERATEMLEAVGISDPPRRMAAYPHQLSGGMRQRVVIAMALLCEPALLFADEPTTALDVTIQAQVLGLMSRLQARHGMAMVFVTHDLAVVAGIADEVAVMYSGRIVERAPVDTLFAAPQHPYTRALLTCRPAAGARRDEPLPSIAGLPPLPHERPTGCAFAPRCPLATAACAVAPPPLRSVGAAGDHDVACVHPGAEGVS